MFRPKIRPLASGVQPTPLIPQQVAQLYAFPPATGAGRTIGVISLGGGYSAADLQAAGIDPKRITLVPIDSAANQYTGNPQSADAENALDLQILGLAFAGSIKLFLAPNSDQGFIDAVAAAMTDPSVCAVTCSWGAPETAWAAAAAVAMRRAIDGSKPFFCASGDSGPDDGTSAPVADFPACAENATACGGTKLIANGAQIASETDWNDSALGGGEEGYGISRSIPAPAWQGGAAWRQIPDVVLNAAPETGYAIQLDGRVLVFGGTSAAAPMAAAGYARLADALGFVQPWFNAAIYQAGTAAFNTVTLDAGDPPSCVGLGSPNLTRLQAALAPLGQSRIDAAYAAELAAISVATPSTGDVLVTVPWYATLTQAVSWSRQATEAQFWPSQDAHPSIVVPMPPAGVLK